MTKYSFSSSERFAVYVTHDEVCYMCNEPIDFKSMQIDHIIPESLLKDAGKLINVLNSFGLPNTFDLNSYENWMPACDHCNKSKLATVFKPSPIVQVNLQKASKKAAKARALAEKLVTENKVTKALLTLTAAIEQNKFNESIIEKIQPLIELHKLERDKSLTGKPIKLTPLYEIISEENGIRYVKGPYGFGSRPAGEHVHGSFNCPNCGTAGAWNGARCVICGQMDDD